MSGGYVDALTSVYSNQRKASGKGAAAPLPSQAPLPFLVSLSSYEIDLEEPYPNQSKLSAMVA
jgi:hypothetical protein